MEGLEGDSHSVFGKEGVGEDLQGFLKQEVFGFVARGEVTDDELPGMGIEGNLCGLSGCAVVGFLGEESMLLGEGGFVVEAGDALKQFGQLGTVGGVGAVGVGAHGVGRCGESVVGDEGAVFVDPVHACLDVVDL